MHHRPIFAKEQIFAKLSQLEQLGGLLILAFDLLDLTLELFDQSRPVPSRTKPLLDLLPEFHEPVSSHSHWGNAQSKAGTFIPRSTFSINE
jgi:hypothetical protein